MVFQFYGVFSLKGGENNKLIILEGEAAQLDVASQKRKKFILSPMFYHLKMGTLSFDSSNSQILVGNCWHFQIG